MRGRRGPLACVLVVASIGVAQAGLQAQSEPSSSVAVTKVSRDSSLVIPAAATAIPELPVAEAAHARKLLSSLGIVEAAARFDRRSGRFATLLPTQPLLPGTGSGNELTWAALGASIAPDTDAVGAFAVEALTQFLSEHRRVLGIDVEELGEPRVSVHDGGRLIQIHRPRVLQGIPVRGSSLTAVVNHGNLTLLGARRWGRVEVATRPDLTAPQARAAAMAYLQPLAIRDVVSSELVLLPTAVNGQFAVGHGYRFRLAWALRFRIEGVPGRWEALVDARSGEILSFVDINTYGTPRKVSGGVYPTTNDGTDPEGLEQAGYPMPFADVDDGTNDRFTDSGGNLQVCVDGDMSTALSGKFAVTQDACGALDESSSSDLDLGTSSGNDCAVPAGGSSGNTHSARTVYYTLNRMRESGLGHLPANAWLNNGRLNAVSNFPSEFFLGCNAIWDGAGVLFTTSAEPDILLPVACSNTGELASVVAHEWAHGLDDNDADGNVSSPPEGIADVLAALWFNDSCVGRGFYEGTACSSPAIADGFGQCLTCDGVREIDWRQRSGQVVHDIAWIDSNCSPPVVGAGGPCGGSVHCEGHLISEAAWDLAHHDLQAAPFNLGPATALEVTTRLFYLGSGLVGDWFQCTPGAGTGDACNADSGYLNLLAVDDDNGNLADGTPHMSAIHAAFDRHGIACSSPTPTDSGCAGAPTTAPTLSVQALDRAAALSWGAVAGADRYQVFRSEGIAGCSAGKIKVGETSDLAFVDQGLQNGFDYTYTLLPVGASASCLGPASNCEDVVPTPGPNLGIDEASASLSFFDGDGDAVIDNCESVQLDLDLHNIGSATLSNIVLTDVEVVSHPGSIVVLTGLPAPVASSMDLCEVAQVSFTFLADGVSFNDVVELRVLVSADELAGRQRSAVLRFGQAESDFQFFASKTFDFDADLGGWELIEGTFDRTDVGSGADGTSHYVASSNDIPNRCDQIRSPLMRLQPTSTLAAWTNFDIEPLLDIEGTIFWFDRANVGVVDPLTGTRNPITPDGGRAYNAGGTDGTCATASQPGWAGGEPTWAESTWSASALGSASVAGEAVQLDVAFGTDDGNWDGESRYGFWFDQVTVTDLDLLVPDSQSDDCTAPVCNADAVCDPGETRCNCSVDCGAPDQVLTSMTVETVEVFEDCSSLTAGPNFAVVAGGDASLKAPTVNLRPGVTVAPSGVLRVGH